MQPTIVLVPRFHRGGEQLFFQYVLSSDIPTGCLDQEIRKLKQCRWSRTHRQWYIPFSKEGFLEAQQRLATLSTLETATLRRYLEQRSRVVALKRGTALQAEPVAKEVSVQNFKTYGLSEGNTGELLQTLEILRLMA